MKSNILFLTLLFSVLFSFNNTAKANCTPIQSFTAVDSTSCETDFFLNVDDPNNFNPNAYTYSWNLGDGQYSTDSYPIHNYSNPGSYNVTLFVTNGPCTDTIMQTIVVGPCDSCDLDASFNFTKDTVECLKVSFHSGPTSTNNNYTWDFGDNTTYTSTGPSSYIENIYDHPGTYQVTLHMTSGNCTESTTQTVVVDSCSSYPCSINTSFSHFGDTLDCLNVSFYSGLTLTNNSYTWDFGDNTTYAATGTNSSIQHAYGQAGTYQVTLHMTSGNCSDSTVQTIVVEPCPTDSCNIDASFWHGDSSCYEFFVPYTYNNNPNAQYEWYFGDGSTSTDAQPEHLYNIPGTYTVTLFVNDGTCSDSTMQNVVVPPCDTCNVDATFNYYPDTLNCEMVFYANSTNNQQYYWDFGDGATSTEVNPSHEYSSPGTYTVSLISYVDNCVDTTTQSVTVLPCDSCDLDASFGYMDTTDCRTAFYPIVYNSNADYMWDFGDGETSTSTIPSHDYNTPGTYTVTLWVHNNSCSDTSMQVVVVTPCDSCDLDAGFSTTENGENTYDFSPTGYDSGNNYLWVFGDGSTSSDVNVTHEFPAEGNYYVTLVVSNCTCSTSSTEEINVSDSTSCSYDANFSYTMDNNGNVVFTPDYQSSSHEYLWDFGDGLSSNTMSPSHSYNYTNTNTFLVSLTIWDPADSVFCEDSTQQLLTLPIPCNHIIEFIYHWDANNDVYYFYPDLVNNNFDYFWDFGDGNTSTQTTPQHSYSNNGIYEVLLRVTRDSCVTEDTTQLNILTAGLSPSENNTSEITIYPNPANDVVYLDFKIAQDGDYNVVMIDAIGQVVQQDDMQLFKGENKKEINLNSFSKGMYQIQIRDKTGDLVKASKLVKQ